MKYIGYHRTSTKEQNLDRGIIEINKFCSEYGIELFKNKVYTDQSCGKDFERQGYILVKELLEQGDALIVSELDRLGRTKTKILKELQYFKENGIRVMIIELPTTLMKLDMSNEFSQMILETINNLLIEMYATFSETEMLKREKRQREGIEAMKERGEWEKYGRPRQMSMEEFTKQHERVLLGEIKPFDLIKEMGIKTQTYYTYKRRYDKEHKGKVMKIENGNIIYSELEMEKEIEDIKASLAIEGIEMTTENIENTMLILTEKADLEKIKENIIKKYKNK